MQHIDVAWGGQDWLWQSGLVLVLVIWVFAWRKPRYWPAYLEVPIAYVMLLDVRVRVLAALKAVVLALVVGRVIVGLVLDNRTRRGVVGSDLGALTLLMLCAAGAGFGLVAGYPIESVITAVYVIIVPVVYYVLARATSIYGDDLITISALFAIGALPLAVVGLSTPGRFIIGSAAVGGYLSHIGLLYIIYVLVKGDRVSWLVPVVIVGSVLALDLAVGGSRRFWIPAFVMSLVAFGTIGSVRGMVAGIIICGVAGVGAWYLGVADIVMEATRRGVGYRGAEYQIAFEHGIRHQPVFGSGLGAEAPVQAVGTKGRFAVGPRFHNFYLTILFNGGIVLLAAYVWWLGGVLSRARRFIAKANAGIEYQLVMALLVGWLVMAAFAAPRGGHWLIGVLAAVLVNASLWSRRGASE